MLQDQGQPSPEWFPTAEAAHYLGVSCCTLKRYAKRDQILLEGTHFCRGPHSNTPLLWHVQRCFNALRGGNR